MAPAAKAAAATGAAGESNQVVNPATDPAPASAKSKSKFSVQDSETPEFEVSGAPHWDPDSGSPSGEK
jgi:hypothetical protein